MRNIKSRIVSGLLSAALCFAAGASAFPASADSTDKLTVLNATETL